MSITKPDGCISKLEQFPGILPMSKDFYMREYPCDWISDAMENHDSGTGWIGVDLDGTLAEYYGFKGLEHIGPPVPLMLERVRRWLAEGREVRIFTARASDPRSLKYIHEWLVRECRLPPLKITNVKDPDMEELWDDRVVNVAPNTGMPRNKSPRGLD